MPESRTRPAPSPQADIVDDDPPHHFILDPIRGGISSAIAARLSTWRPTAVFTVTFLAGYVLLAAGLIALGLLLTEVLLPIDPVLEADQAFPSYLEDNRTADLTDLSYAASLAGDIPVLPILVILAIIVGLIARKMIVGVFLLAAVAAEVTLYRLGTIVVPRNRPDVERLDVLPVDHSFPSGHVAASLVVYVGIALLVASRCRAHWTTVLTWAVGVLMVIAVAVSRIYRGMHHPLDALSGTLLGIGCLLIALVAVRAYGAARERHSQPADITPNNEVLA